MKILPDGAEIIGPNTMSIPSDGTYSEFTPPRSEPPFDYNASRVVVWFRTWAEAVEFVKKIKKEEA